MKAIIHQTFGDVIYLNSRTFQLAHVDNTLMRHKAMISTIQNGIVRLEPRRNVIGVEDGNLSSKRQAAASHHGNIGIGNGQDAGTSPRRSRNRSPLLPIHATYNRMRRQEWY